jgi:hypothetical protein
MDRACEDAVTSGAIHGECWCHCADIEGRDRRGRFLGSENYRSNGKRESEAEMSHARSISRGR